MKREFLVFLFFLITASLHAQDNHPPFWKDIQAFKKQDSITMPPKNAILFIGSSSFTRWKNVQDYFPEYPIINRGFGGSSLPDLIAYTEEIVFPYQPSQVVIYCGENDVAASDTITATTVFNRFKILFEIIRSRLPQIPVLFVSLKPSPSRWQRRETMLAVNDLVKRYLETKTNTVFVDVWPAMLGEDGLPVDALFVADKLHMTEKGYAIWQKALAPHLKK